MQGLPCLMLTTTGRRSAEPRDVVLQYAADDGRFVVVASFAGEPRDPAWYHNLVAHPDVEVTVGGRRFGARAATAVGAERDRLAALVADAGHGLPHYQERVDRPIPIVTLEPH